MADETGKEKLLQQILSTRKNTLKKVEQSIGEIVPAVTVVGKRPPIGYKSDVEFKENQDKALQAFRSHISDLLGLIVCNVIANVENKINVPGIGEIPIAAAVAFKRDLENLRDMQVRPLKSRYSSVLISAEKLASQVEIELEKQIQSLTASDKGGAKTNVDDFIKLFRDNKGISVLTSDKVKDFLTSVDQKIGDMISEIDSQLSIINATKTATSEPIAVDI